MTATYSTKFFESVMDASYDSARTVAPRVISLCEPRSVADFGCGVGSWLRAFEESGIADITGVDGDYVNQDLLMIPRDRFITADLTKPIHLQKRFDLVVSLEVGEHLPADASQTLVDTLTSHASVILFSAAVPGQGGEHHVNEQWANYWSAAFAKRGFRAVDCLRDFFWDNDAVDWWYRQNMFLYVAEDALSQYPRLMEEASRPKTLPLAIVHPGFIDALSQRDAGLRSLAKQLPSAIRATFHRAMRIGSTQKRRGDRPDLPAGL